MKHQITLILLGLLFPLFLPAQPTHPLEQAWAKDFSSAEEIIKQYKQLQKQASLDILTRNDCYMLFKSGEYIMHQKGESKDIPILLKQIPNLQLENPTVIQFMNEQGPDKFVDYYFTIKALKKNVPFSEARDGLSPSTAFPERPLNRYDYNKLEVIFKGKNKHLQSIYLEKMRLLFRNSGCTDGMVALRPTIEKNIPESPLKNDILQLYNRYEKIRKGQPAPTPTLKDPSGKEYSFKDFLGKVIVVDVWATWCCSCIENMPSFIKLRDEFRDNNNVIFLTVSIDRKNAHAKWLKAIEDNKMHDMLNLITDNEEQSPFETEYCIPGVPRHFVIDQQGKIVDVYAPHGDALKQMILNTLKK